MLESKYQSQSHLRCFGNWWGRHTCSGSGFGKLQHSQFLAAATVAFEHGEEHGLAAPTFVGRQSYRVPWFSSLTLNRIPQKRYSKHFESIPIEQTVFPTLPAEPRSMDVYEIAVNFQDPLHQGDRRKKSQQCILINPPYRFFWQIQQVLRGSKLRRKPKVFLNYYPNESISLDRHGWSWDPCQRCLRQEQSTPWFDLRGGEIARAGFAKPRWWPATGPPLQSCLKLASAIFASWDDTHKI